MSTEIDPSSKLEETKEDIMQPTPEKHLHRGSCHCQAIVFSVLLEHPLDPGMCDCSYCAKRGIIWGWAKPEDIKLENGDVEKDLEAYAFANKTWNHLSCKKCATYVGSSRVGETWPSAGPNVDARGIPFSITALRDIDIHDLQPYIKYKSASRAPHFTPPPPLPHSFPSSHTTILPPPSNPWTFASAVAKTFKPQNEEKVYHGSCHCGEVRFVVESLGMREQEVCWCNCSICASSNAIWIYPRHEKYIISTSPHPSTPLTPSSSPTNPSILISYAFTPTSPSQNVFYSCPTCHCAIYERREKEGEIGLNLRLVDNLSEKEIPVEVQGGGEGGAVGGGKMLLENVGYKGDYASVGEKYVIR